MCRYGTRHICRSRAPTFCAEDPMSEGHPQRAIGARLVAPSSRLGASHGTTDLALSDGVAD
jgi:hypothetical protein